jgi:hypothetical protein
MTVRVIVLTGSGEKHLSQVLIFEFALSIAEGRN